MILEYLSFLKCVIIILVCNDNLEYQIDDQHLKLYSALRGMTEEINTRISDIQKKRKNGFYLKPRFENIKIKKIITNFEIETIQIFTELIHTENIPNSKNVNLKEILRLFNFLGINEKSYLIRFYQKIFHLIFLKNAAIIESPPLEYQLIPKRMMIYILNKFQNINIEDFSYTPADYQLINKMKSTEKNLILFSILENQSYQKQFTLFLNSQDNYDYDDQILNLISSQIIKFKEIAIIMRITTSIFLDRLAKEQIFIENLDYLTLDIYNNFSDQELNAISKFKNVKKLDIFCNFESLIDDINNNMILRIPGLVNLKYLRIFEFHCKDIDISNIDCEKIETLALIDCIYVENILFRQWLFPNLKYLSISLALYDLILIDQISIMANNLIGLKSIAIFFHNEDVYEEKCLELIKSGKFKTNLVAFISSDKSSIFILENNSDVDHSKFYDMIEIPDYQEFQFFDVTEFPDLKRHSKFYLNMLKFNNLILSDFNFEIWNKYAFVKTFIFDEVLISKKATDSLRKIENIFSLKFQSVIFEDTNCFKEIIEKNNDTIKVIEINKTNLSFNEISGIAKIQNLLFLWIDHHEFTINNYETLLTHDFKDLGVIQIMNGENISRRGIYLLLKYKNLFYVGIKNIKPSARSLLVTNAGEIIEENENFMIYL
ncbi:hypothetical protein DMUE_3148 [Dictyocoela muelleri]|nr:hypothetical protein DMUE_3148 [Dictyocoela muelleri]